MILSFCWLLGIAAVAASGAGLAQPAPDDAVPGGVSSGVPSGVPSGVEIPPMPVSPYPGDSVSAPEVTIIETDTQIITEYRVRGQLYMVQIEPVAGPPYYLIDSNGDGVLDVQQSDPLSTAVQQWRLFSW